MRKEYKISLSFVGGILLALFAATFVTGCTNDDVLTSHGGEKAISYQPVEILPKKTRAAYQYDSFGAYATVYRNIADASPLAYIINEKVADIDNSSTNIWDSENVYYWFDYGYTVFSAYAPYEASVDGNYRPTVGASLSADGETAEGSTYTYTNYTNDGTDLLFADVFPADNAHDAGNLVPVAFNHALAKVTFNIRAYTLAAESTTWEIIVNSLTVKNVRTSGSVTFTYDVADDGTAAWVTNNADAPGAWNVGADTEDFTLITSANKLTLTTEAQQLGEDYIVIPQQLLTDGTDATDQIFEIDYTVTATITDAGVSQTTPPATMSAKMRLHTDEIAQWAAGKHIVYDIVVPPADPIQFDPNALDWADGSEIAIPTTVTAYDTANGKIMLDDAEVPEDASSEVSLFEATKLEAIPSAGYIFEKWIEYGNPSNVLSTENPYYHNGATDISITAVFISAPSIRIINADTAMGAITVDGTDTDDTTVTPANSNGTIELVATPIEGYMFDCWEELKAGAIDAVKLSTEPSYTYRSTTPATITARFKAAHKVTVKSNDVSMGLAGINGKYATAEGLSEYVADGETTTIIANVRDGYIFDGWKPEGSDDYISTERIYEYVDATGADVTFTAYFRLPNITAMVADECAGMGLASVEDAPEGGKNLVAQVVPGYRFVKWEYKASGLLLSNEPILHYGLAIDAEIVAYFEADDYSYIQYTTGSTDNFYDIKNYNQYVSSFMVNGSTEIYSVTDEDDMTSMHVSVPGVITVKRGQSFNFSWDTPDDINASLYITAYIDTDGNGVYDTDSNADGGELITVLGTKGTQNDAIKSGTVTVNIPSDAVLGQVVMRWRFDSAWNSGISATGAPVDAYAETNRMVYDIIVEITE